MGNLTIMGNEISSFSEAVSIADYFAGTDLVPKDYRGKGANIMVAWQKGIELGLQPLQSLATIAVVNGRATIWGDGLIALVKNSSKEEWTHETLTGEGDNMVATCETKRSSQEQTIVRSFSVADATKAGLWGNNTWAKYPKRMLQMRARGLCLRDAYPDVLNGLEIAEEMNDLHSQQKQEAEAAPKTLKQLGLTTIEKDGLLIVEGSTYGKSDVLKQLGFTFSGKEWCKELPKGEEIIDIQITESINNSEPKKENSPALDLMKYLINKGIEKARIGEFVKDVLGTSSKDTQGIELALADKNALDLLIENFLAEPSVEEIDIDDVF
ncbi:MAG: hypothetical protein U9P72_02220 [Campylobacterota bacterium]|nr:hypothetical protein [Campylobacterota bacterium]